MEGLWILLGSPILEVNWSLRLASFCCKTLGINDSKIFVVGRRLREPPCDLSRHSEVEVGRFILFGIIDLKFAVISFDFLSDGSWGSIFLDCKCFI